MAWRKKLFRDPGCDECRTFEAGWDAAVDGRWMGWNEGCDRVKPAGWCGGSRLDWWSGPSVTERNRKPPDALRARCRSRDGVRGKSMEQRMACTGEMGGQAWWESKEV